MARPQPKPIMERTDPESFITDHIVEAPGTYVVYYKGKPFNYYQDSAICDWRSKKYKRNSFSNPGHAFNLAEKLNKLFKTTDFAVYLVKDGEIIKEEKTK